MQIEYWGFWQKGIRPNNLRQLILLMARYCYGNEDTAVIDFYGRFAKTERTLEKMKDVVDLFVKKEGMSQRRAYDFAQSIKKIQFMTG